MTTQIKTQTELDAALQAGKLDFEFVARGEFSLKGFKNLHLKVAAALKFDVLLLLENATATLRENATATLLENATATLLENATATLWGNATATLWGNATATLRENATAKAKGYCSLSLYGTAKAVIAETCHAFIMSAKVKCRGGKQTKAKLKTALDWCNYYGVEVKNGVAIVYKALNEDFSAKRDRSFKYLPGTAPKAPEFDKANECSHGLHFSPTPEMAKTYFHIDAKKFVACPVKVSEMVPHFDGSYPHKIKAPRVFKQCWEVDINGKKIEQPAPAKVAA